MYKEGWVYMEPGQPPTLTDFPSTCGDKSVPQAVCAGEWEGASSLCDPGPQDPHGSLMEALRGLCTITHFTFCPLKEKW